MTTEKAFLTMSTNEINRLETIQHVVAGTLTQTKAGKLLGVSDRQVRRLKEAYLREGANGLISKKRGQPSNRTHTQEVKSRVLELVKAHYSDFGPTLASEKLLERHKVRINHETLRHWMISENLWRPKARKTMKTHERRLRRSHFGELVQIDGSPHDWFEGRAERCTLIVFIDDATSRIISARFFPAETTFAYFEMVKLHFERYGKPRAYYSDKHSIFRINHKDALGGTGMTQFERAMKNVEVDLINAHSPQAKGRVERMNQTLQDRLVKELRLQNINEIDTANAFLDDYLEILNQRFAILPRETEDLHQAPPDKPTLALQLSFHEERKLSKTLTLQFEKNLYQIKVQGEGYTLRQAKVTVCKDKNDNITILYKNRPLKYSVFDKQMQHSQIKTSKEIELGFRVQRGIHRPPASHPWKRDGSVRKAPLPENVPLRGDY